MLHTPVLLSEIIELLDQSTRPLEWGLDVTFGRGGHTAAFLRRWPQLKMWACDRDRQALEFGEQEFPLWIQEGRLVLQQQNFHQELPTSPKGSWDFILADLGVSSPQLDQAERGFSFYNEGPLDMRMDQSQGITAADIVNEWSDLELEELFRELGEVHRPRRVVERIIQSRKTEPFRTTSQLSQLIEKTDGWRKKGQHPATQYFLALRLEVNQELAPLAEACGRMIQALSPGGRLMIITFHSLEDRIIKYAFREQLSLGRLVNKKVIVPSRDESGRNPRARSAKLRCFERNESV